MSISSLQGESAPDVLTALRDRQSMRAYKDQPLDLDIVARILDAARHAPSGTNTQPWHVVVVSDEARQRLCQRVLDTRQREPERERSAQYGEYRYYADPMTEPYLSRRREVGWDMYRSMGVQRGDRAASWEVAARNYRFFDAPVGLIFTLDRALEKGSWIDLGIFLQSVMLAARHYGVDTCAQGAWARYHDVIRDELAIADDHIIVCGMSMGYGDSDAPANAVRARKEPLESFVRYVGGSPSKGHSRRHLDGATT